MSEISAGRGSRRRVTLWSSADDSAEDETERLIEDPKDEAEKADIDLEGEDLARETKQYYTAAKHAKHDMKLATSSDL